MRVVMLSPEVYPYAKTGGLADVLAALPPALVAAGVEVTVCVPGYRSALRAAGTPAPGTRLHAPIASRMEPVEMVRVPGAPVPTVLLRADRYFDRDGLYGEGGRDWPDNSERFAFFCRAALEWLRAAAEPPDVLHVHEWQSALAPAFLRGTAELYPELARVRTVLTLHNLAYQGRFPPECWHLLNLDARYFVPEFLEFHAEINFLKAGLVFADALTTVSPRYAGEIQTPAFGEGLDGVLRARHAALRHPERDRRRRLESGHRPAPAGALPRGRPGRQGPLQAGAPGRARARGARRRTTPGHRLPPGRAE